MAAASSAACCNCTSANGVTVFEKEVLQYDVQLPLSSTSESAGAVSFAVGSTGLGAGVGGAAAAGASSAPRWAFAARAGTKVSFNLCSRCQTAKMRKVADAASAVRLLGQKSCSECSGVARYMLLDRMAIHFRCMNCVVGSYVAPMVDVKELASVATAASPSPGSASASPSPVALSASDLAAAQSKMRERYTTGQTLLETRLQRIVGMESVKERLRRWFHAECINAGELFLLPAMGRAPRQRPPVHFSIEGSPGTGKSTVARIIADLLFKLQLVRSDKFKSLGSGSELTGEHVGQTKAHVRKLCDDVRDGVLFIDEAYAVTKGSGSSSFALEAVTQLMAEMGDPGGDPAYPPTCTVILAGYVEDMKTFFAANEGLKSRISMRFVLPDYSCADIAAIFRAKFEAERWCIEPADFFDNRLEAELESEVPPALRRQYNGRLWDRVMELSVQARNGRLDVEDFINDPQLYWTYAAEDIVVGIKRFVASANASK